MLESRVLKKIGPSQELSHYLGLYTITPATQFAVLKISGSCLERESLEKIAEDLSDLYSLGLIPIVTHGWGSPLTERLKQTGIESRVLEKLKPLGIQSMFIDGDRYTDSEVMIEVGKIAEETANNLLKAIEAKDGKAQIITYHNRVIIAKRKEDRRYGEHNGDIEGIDTRIIEATIERGYIPIIYPIGITRDRIPININAAVVGAEFAKIIDPIKYVMVTSEKGVLDENKNLISEIILRRDLKGLKERGIIKGGMLKNVEEAAYCLEVRENGDDRSVQIVSPGNLLYELFTHKGAGTFIRNGYIVEEKPMQEVDESIVKEIVRDSLGEELASMYYKERCEQGATIFIERNLKGLGIVIGNYLDIFAVREKYQRNGLGTDIFTAIRAKKPKFSWRSQTYRPINLFYFGVSDGHQQFVGPNKDLYNGFWIGYTLEEVAALIDFMQKKPSNFKQSTALK